MRLAKNAGSERARNPLAAFARSRTSDLFDKCRRFLGYIEPSLRSGQMQAQYRVELTSGLDHHITVIDPFTKRPRQMICFDSNSYLGLHRHPRAVAAARRAVDDVGFGTPSAQVLGGTNRYLLELEETIAGMYGREGALIFPSGYAANIGILTALLGPDDIAFIDRFAHASIHDGCRYAGASRNTYGHLDTDHLERKLRHANGAARGKLIVTDGVFSMHGDVAPLPQLRALADRHGARLMVDEAHALGVIGPKGMGTEDHFGMHASVDVLMGTFSKAPGSAGGYVVGDRALIEYLRYFARAGLFTAALPAPICAGLNEALKIMQEEPEHRTRLWRNARMLWNGLRGEGLEVPPLHSPIVTVRVGSEDRMQALAVAVFNAGIKCGIAQYPAVPRGESMLRITVNARHTEEDIRRAVHALGRVGARAGILRDDCRQRRAS